MRGRLRFVLLALAATLPAFAVEPVIDSIDIRTRAPNNPVVKVWYRVPKGYEPQGKSRHRVLVLFGARGFLTAAGGNGVEYGIKVAGSDKWYTAPAPMIEGPYLVEGAKRENQLPWIGDSSITECRGWGGQICAVNPEIQGCVVINGGMMDVNGGWMGAGSTRMPQECFDKAREDGHNLVSAVPRF